MRRADRLFQIIQSLRRRARTTRSGLTRAQDLAEELEVSVRTVYRDIADLQGSGVPIEGAAGVGYVLREGYDLPPMMFIKSAPNSHGFVNPHDVEQYWRDQFDWVYREYDYAVFTMTIHPDISGRPHVLMMLERLFAYLSSHPGVTFTTFDAIAEDFRQRFPRGAVDNIEQASLARN